MTLGRERAHISICKAEKLGPNDYPMYRETCDNYRLYNSTVLGHHQPFSIRRFWYWCVFMSPALLLSFVCFGAFVCFGYNDPSVWSLKQEKNQKFHA